MILLLKPFLTRPRRQEQPCALTRQSKGALPLLILSLGLYAFDINTSSTRYEKYLLDTAVSMIPHNAEMFRRNVGLSVKGESGLIERGEGNVPQ